MAVVKSLKNAKHKRLWVKKFYKINNNNSNFIVFKSPSSKFKNLKKFKKQFDWTKQKQIQTQLYNYNKIYNLFVINLFYLRTFN